MKEKIIIEMSEFVQQQILVHSKAIPPLGWALTNIVSLAIGNENGSGDPGCFHQGLDHALYVHVVIFLAESLLARLDNVGWKKKEKVAIPLDAEISAEPIDTLLQDREAAIESLMIPYVDQFRPLCQQWHLKTLLASVNRDATNRSDVLLPNNLECLEKLDLCDIAFFY